MRSPHIIILSPVLSFIEEEVMKVDYPLETGGLLLGSKLPHGRLITHATPPGPKAFHHPGMFERDLEFSRAALDHFTRQTGVDYVGEWHKHPPSMIRPSEDDRKGVIEILKDPDYRTGDLVIFPIWIRKQSTALMHSPLHQCFVEHFYRVSGRSIHCFPYYMDNSLEFHSFKFDVAECDLNTQNQVQKFYKRYIDVNGRPTGNTFPSFGRHLTTKSSDFTDRNDTNNNEISSQEIVEDSQNLDDKNARLPGKTPQHKVSWFETQDGKARLSAESKSLKATGCYQGARLLPNGRLTFGFESPKYEGVIFHVVCRKDHPSSFPDLFLWHRGKYVDVLNSHVLQEGPETLLQLTEKIKELRRQWLQSESTMMIADIANALGFNRFGKWNYKSGLKIVPDIRSIHSFVKKQNYFHNDFIDYKPNK